MTQVDRQKVSAAIHAVELEFATAAEGTIQSFRDRMKGLKDLAVSVLKNSPVTVDELMKYFNLDLPVLRSDQISLLIKTRDICLKIREEMGRADTVVRSLQTTLDLTMFKNIRNDLIWLKGVMDQKARQQGTVVGGDTDSMMVDVYNELVLSRRKNTFDAKYLNPNKQGLSVLRRAIAAYQQRVSSNTAVFKNGAVINLLDALANSCLSAQAKADALLPMPDDNGAQNVANLYMIDYVVLAALAEIHYDLNDEKWDALAAYTMSKRLNDSAWRSFCASNEWATNIREGKTMLYDSPFKCFKERTLGLACCMFLGSHQFTLTMAYDWNKFPPFFKSIFDKERAAGLISTQPGTTSTSEHVFHQLLMNGRSQIHVNRNFLSGSSVSVKFTFEGVTAAIQHAARMQAVSHHAGVSASSKQNNNPALSPPDQNQQFEDENKQFSPSGSVHGGGSSDEEEYSEPFKTLGDLTAVDLAKFHRFKLQYDNCKQWLEIRPLRLNPDVVTKECAARLIPLSHGLSHINLELVREFCRLYDDFDSADRKVFDEVAAQGRVILDKQDLHFEQMQQENRLDEERVKRQEEAAEVLSRKSREKKVQNDQPEESSTPVIVEGKKKRQESPDVPFKNFNPSEVFPPQMQTTRIPSPVIPVRPGSSVKPTSDPFSNTTRTPETKNKK